VVKGRSDKLNEFLAVVSEHPVLSVSPNVLNFLEIAEKVGLKAEDIQDPEPSLIRVCSPQFLFLWQRSECCSFVILIENVFCSS